MANGTGPWSRDPQPRAAPSRAWLGLVAAIAVLLLVWALSAYFPDAIYSDMDRARLIQLIGMLVLVSSGVVLGRRFRGRESLRNVLIWCGIFAILIVGYTLRDDFAQLGNKVLGDLIPDRAVQTGPHELTLTADQDDSFYTSGTINGARAEFLIDTGASSVVLSPADAERAGIDLSSVDYTNRFESAHGEGRGASFVVERLTIGPIELHHVPVVINQSPMRTSLLGLTFLRRLDSFEMRGRKLMLRWH